MSNPIPPPPDVGIAIRQITIPHYEHDEGINLCMALSQVMEVFKDVPIHQRDAALAWFLKRYQVEFKQEYNIQR